MTSDKRMKGCSNESCQMHEKMVMQKSEIDYCPKCGTKLIYVCSKCFREIENTDVKHRICGLCEAEQEEKRTQRNERIKEVAVKAGKYVLGFGSAVVAGVLGTVIKDGQKGAVKVGVNAVKSVAKAVLKK